MTRAYTRLGACTHEGPRAGNSRLCNPCYRETRPKKPCLECREDRVIIAHGLCNPCYQRQMLPAKLAARRKRKQDPAWRAKQAEQARAWKRKRLATPEGRARYNELRRAYLKRRALRDPEWLKKQQERSRARALKSIQRRREAAA